VIAGSGVNFFYPNAKHNSSIMFFFGCCCCTCLKHIVDSVYQSGLACKGLTIYTLSKIPRSFQSPQRTLSVTSNNVPRSPQRTVIVSPKNAHGLLKQLGLPKQRFRGHNMPYDKASGPLDSIYTYCISAWCPVRLPKERSCAVFQSRMELLRSGFPFELRCLGKAARQARGRVWRRRYRERARGRGCTCAGYRASGGRSAA